MVGALGAEVDRLEQEVRLLVPGLRHIDLETDRGRRDGTASQVGLSSLCLPVSTPIRFPIQLVTLIAAG